VRQIAAPSCHGPSVAAKSTGGWVNPMRHYEVMVILDPELDERTIAPSLDTFLSVIKKDGGSVEKVDVWGKRRLSFEINKKSEGIYAVIDISAEPASVIELDRQLNLNESVLRTKVLRPIPQKAKSKKAQDKAQAKRAEKKSA
ncbi:MAG: small subunit ribosomal protein, partial [Pseudonocardiales bacterium]|nr:small subunit ribosomal protein [Pseudonocardiales bacterium]